MPNYFALIRIQDKDKPQEEQKYVPLEIVDEEICKALGKSVHPTEYYMGWYDSIGLMLACGKTFEEIESLANSWYPESEESPILDVIKFMKENYISSSWARIGK